MRIRIGAVLATAGWMVAPVLPVAAADPEKASGPADVPLGVGAALAAVLVGGGVYAVMQIDSGTAAEPIQPPPSTTPQTYNSEAEIGPGTYRMLVGVDANGVAIHADLTFDGVGWSGGSFPVLNAGGQNGGVAVYQPTALAASTGCLSDEPNNEVAQTSQALAQQLAQQLAQLPRSTVLQAPTSVQAFGRNAFHLRLRIDCGSGEAYRVVEALRGSHGINYSPAPSLVDIDFWAMDIEGVAVVVDTWHEAGASDQLVDQVARTGESITFVTGG